MADRPLKNWPKSLFSKETQTRTRHYYIHSRTDKIKRIDHAKCWWECWVIGTPMYCWEECKHWNHFWKQFAVSYKVKCTIAKHPINFIPRNLKKEKLKHIHTKTYMWMFRVLFIKFYLYSQNWKQDKCPSTDEKLCSSHIMNVTQWWKRTTDRHNMHEPQNIILSEWNQI